jgi:nucleoside-diphosphate-sugar epimerase
MTQPRPSPTPSLFCFGLGFSARRFAERWLAAGGKVAGTQRTPRPLPDGVEALPFDPSDPAVAERLLNADAILSSVPPAGDGSAVEGPIEPVLSAFGALLPLSRARWVGYLSTTGVYGDTGGAAVTEETPLNPISERSRNRLAAEQAWLSLPLPVHIFRLSGIYGPGRGPLSQLKAGTARRIIKPGHRMNRIHVEDIAGMLEASWRKPNPGAAYNLSDNEPAESSAVIEFAAGLLGIEPPPATPFNPAVLTPMAASFYAEHKWVSNQRVREELEYQLVYPTYREGLAADIREG